MFDVQPIICLLTAFLMALSVGVLLFPVFFSDWYELMELTLRHVSPGLLASLDGTEYFSWRHSAVFAIYVTSIGATAYYSHVGMALVLTSI